MSWMHQLYATYEYCVTQSAFVTPAEDGSSPLMPISHTSQQVHIHVVLSSEGNFVRAELLGKQPMIIPATESSAGRTSGKAPHPLIDKIHYCAKSYCGTKENLYAQYEEQLGAWCASPHVHPKACAVYAYVRKGTLINDLVRAGILFADDQGALLTAPPEVPDTESAPANIFKFLTPKKVQGHSQRDQGDALVCWSVESTGDHEPRTWKDTSLQQAWISYNAEQLQDAHLCMVSGRTLSSASQHPRNLRWPGDGAKLISSNDAAGFTYRGKFDDPAEACTVGYEVSHKIHNALRWLIARQGTRQDTQVVVAWAQTGIEVPNPCEGSWFCATDSPTDEALPDFDLDAPVLELPVQGTHDHLQDLGQGLARALGKNLAGYAATIAPTEHINVLAVDAAGPGRLSVTFSRECLSKEYLARLQRWQKELCWILPFTPPHEKGVKSKSQYRPAAPTPKEIAYAAYGQRLDDKLLKATVERLLPCVTDAAPLPRDLVNMCVRRAISKHGMEEWEWSRVLAMACALFKGYHARHPLIAQRRNYTMTLDTTRNSRDYLFGRLLAVAQYAERRALDNAGEQRPTNAERMMQRFADHPCATWLTLEKQLNPTMQRLQSNESTRGAYVKIQQLLQKICDAFEPAEFINDKALSGEFLLSYHCQLSDFYTKKVQTSPTLSEEKEGVYYEQPAV